MALGHIPVHTLCMDASGYLLKEENLGLKYTLSSMLSEWMLIEF